MELFSRIAEAMCTVAALLALAGGLLKLLLDVESTEEFAIAAAFFSAALVIRNLK